MKLPTTENLPQKIRTRNIPPHVFKYSHPGF